MIRLFRSTGSYEPDLYSSDMTDEEKGFDPQALTSLTLSRSRRRISHVRFDPQALTSLTE